MLRGGRRPLKYKPKVGLVWVRCLGPCEEHWFWSTDRINHRVCDQGKKLQAAIRLMPEAQITETACSQHF